MSEWQDVLSFIEHDMFVPDESVQKPQTKEEMTYAFAHQYAAFSLRFEVTIPEGRESGAKLYVRALPGCYETIMSNIELRQGNVATVPVAETQIRTLKIYQPSPTTCWWPFFPVVLSEVQIDMKTYDAVAARHIESIMILFKVFDEPSDLTPAQGKSQVSKKQFSNDYKYKELRDRLVNNQRMQNGAVAAAAANAQTGIFNVATIGAKFPINELVMTEPSVIDPFLSFHLSAATWDTYRTGYHMYLHYLNLVGARFTLPIQTCYLMGFINFMIYERGVTPKTVNSYMAALKKIHEINGAPLTGWQDPRVNIQLIGFANFYRTRLEEPMPRRAMTFSMLCLFGNQLATLDLTWLDKQLVWLAALWGFWGAARMSAIIVDKHGPDEIRLVTYERVRWLGPDHFTVVTALPKNKEKQTENLDLRTFPDERYCPVTQLNKLVDYLERDGREVRQEQAIFLRSSGKMLTMDAMNAILKLALLPLFPDNGGFWSCHSFRAGLATTMANYPELFSEEEIKAIGRWNSEAFKAYCRTHGITQAGAYQKIFDVLQNH